MEFNEKLMIRIIEEQVEQCSHRRSVMTKYLNYYKGDHNILKRKDTGEGKPNNKLVFNFCSLVINTQHQYLFSNPVSYGVKDQTSFIQRLLNRSKSQVEQLTNEFLEELRSIYFENDEDNVLSSHGKISSILSESIEYFYIDLEGNIRFTQTDPREWSFFTYDGIEYALRTYTDCQYVPTVDGKHYEKEETEFAELFNSRSIYKFRKGNRKEKEWTLFDQREHRFEEIPVIRFKNEDGIEFDTKDSVSDIKDMIVLNDTYNNTMSSLMNTIDYSADPYLVFKNAVVDEDNMKEFKDTRVIMMDGEGSDLEFLEWTQNITSYMESLKTIERLIYNLSNTPDLWSKEGLNNDSGVALQIKFQGVELKSRSKERAFTKALRKRLRLIAKMLELRTNKPYFTSKVYQNISMDFTRNSPRNLKEISEIVNTLSPHISEETKLKLLPFIENPSSEIEKLKEKETGMKSIFEVKPNEPA